MAANNNFYMSGIALTNFVDAGQNGFEKYKLTIEVENSKGKAKKHTIMFMGGSSNRNIDWDQLLTGKFVVVGGVVDSFESRNGDQIECLLGTSLFIPKIDSDKTYAPINNARNDSVVAPKKEQTDLLGRTIRDDDLPF